MESEWGNAESALDVAVPVSSGRGTEQLGWTLLCPVEVRVLTLCTRQSSWGDVMVQCSLATPLNLWAKPCPTSAWCMPLHLTPSPQQWSFTLSWTLLFTKGVTGQAAGTLSLRYLSHERYSPHSPFLWSWHICPLSSQHSTKQQRKQTEHNEGLTGNRSLVGRAVYDLPPTDTAEPDLPLYLPSTQPSLNVSDGREADSAFSRDESPNRLSSLKQSILYTSNTKWTLRRLYLHAYMCLCNNNLRSHKFEKELRKSEETEAGSQRKKMM